MSFYLPKPILTEPGESLAVMFDQILFCEVSPNFCQTVMRIQFDTEQNHCVQRPFSSARLRRSDLHTCLLSSAQRLYERVVLPPRLPGSPRPSLPDGPGRRRPAEAEPDEPAGAGAAPPAQAEPAAAGLLPDAAAAAGRLHAGGSAVAGPPVHHGAAPRWGVPVRGADDAVWRQTQNTLNPVLVCETETAACCSAHLDFGVDLSDTRCPLLEERCT